jgi:hypothetical protein
MSKAWLFFERGYPKRSEQLTLPDHTFTYDAHRGEVDKSLETKVSSGKVHWSPVHMMSGENSPSGKSSM